MATLFSCPSAGGPCKPHETTALMQLHTINVTPKGDAREVHAMTAIKGQITSKKLQLAAEPQAANKLLGADGDVGTPSHIK